MPMVDLTAVLMDSNDEEIFEKANVKMTYARACILALDSALQDDAAEPLSKKLERGKLIAQIKKASKLELSSDDIVLLKGRVGKTFTAASIVHKICLLLDPSAKE